MDREKEEIQKRIQKYRGGKAPASLFGRTVILVDDGLATGATARVSAKYVQSKGAKRVIVAAPVCAQDTASTLRSEVEQVVCLSEPEIFYAVGLHFQDFEQVSDEEVISLLSQVKIFSQGNNMSKENSMSETTPKRTRKEITIHFPMGIKTDAILQFPESSKGTVIFAHGSGSSRLSPRNQQVATQLNDAGLGTLLFDLLTEEEAQNRSNVFNIPLLAKRLVEATTWLKNQEEAKNLPIAFFGASTGGGAALWAAAELKDEICAVVSRGGRPDLALPKLPQVTAATLLIVGGADPEVIDLNKKALQYLKNAKLVIVPAATHLFEEPGALEQVSREANAWFLKHFAKTSEEKRRGAA